MKKIEQFFKQEVSLVWAITVIVVIATLIATAFLVYGYFWAPNTPELQLTRVVKDNKNYDCNVNILGPENYCYNLAVANRNDTYCKNIPDLDVKINCYAGVSMLKNAIEKNNPSLCWTTTI
jgi:hypothetical protein